MTPSSQPSLRARLVGDGISTFATRIASMLLAAALGVLTARVLGSHGRGLYATPMVDAGLVSAGFSGLSSATSFFLLRKGAGRAIVRTAFIAAALLFVVAASAAAAFAVIGHASWAITAAVLSLPGPAMAMLAAGYATGTHRVRLTSLLGSMSVAMALVFMIGVFALGERSARGAIDAWVLSSDVLAVGFGTWVVVDSRRLAPGGVSLREYLHFVLRAGAVGLVSLLNYRADIYIVAVLGTPSMLGMYTLGVSAAETLLAATSVTAVVTAPHIGSLGESDAANLTARSVRHNVIVAGICCALLAIVAPYAVKLLYGDAFMAVVPALRILLVGVFALSLGSPMSTYFTIRLGRPEVPLVLASFSAAVCIAVSIVLVPRIGLVGAALGSTVAYVGGQAAAILYFRAISGIGARAILIPRRADLLTYLQILHLKGLFT